MITKKVAAIFAALGIAVTGVSMVAPASADPVANTYAIVGSDTLEDAVNALVNGTAGNTFRVFSNNSTLGSFDATGNPCIQTKENSSRFTRPNGSSDGLLALVKSMKQEAYTASGANKGLCDRNGVRIDGLVDIARSSSNPGSSNPDFVGTGTTYRSLAWFPFGRDAMAYAYRQAVGSTTAAVDRDVTTGFASRMASLTKDDLTDIFACTQRYVDGELVTPVIPQFGSGTRSSWLTAIGLTEAMMVTVSEGVQNVTLVVNRTTGETAVVSRTGCVQEGQEHDGTSMKVRNSVMPMSVSRWVAMANGLSQNKVGSAILAGSSLVSVSSVPQEPVTMDGTTMVPNPLFYANTTWGRETWLVVEYDRVTQGKTGYDAALADLLDAEQPNSLVNVQTFNPNFAGYWKKKFGILPPNSGTLVKHTQAKQ